MSHGKPSGPHHPCSPHMQDTPIPSHFNKGLIPLQCSSKSKVIIQVTPSSVGGAVLLPIKAISLDLWTCETRKPVIFPPPIFNVGEVWGSHCRHSGSKSGDANSSPQQFSPPARWPAGTTALGTALTRPQAPLGPLAPQERKTKPRTQVSVT